MIDKKTQFIVAITLISFIAIITNLVFASSVSAITDTNGNYTNVEEFSQVIDTTFNYATGDLKYSYKTDYYVIARMFFIVDVTQNVCTSQGWNWFNNHCYLWWNQAKQYMFDNGIDYNVVINKYPTYHKYGFNFSNIPQIIADKLLYVGLHLEGASGLIWDDVQLNTTGHTLLIKNKIRLGFDDLLQAGYTLNLYDKYTILIGNVIGKQNLWLDPTVDTIGDTSGYGASYSTYTLWFPILASASGTLQTVGVNIKAPWKNIGVAIYSNNSGKPYNNLGNSSNVTAVIDWNDITIPGSISIVTGTYYWLGFQASTTNVSIYVASAGYSHYQSTTYGTWVNPAASTYMSSTIYNMRMTYEEATSPTQNNITYSNNVTWHPTNYNSSLTIFNITIGTNTTDGLSYNRSFLEINHTGALVNYTMNRFPLNVSNYNLTLGAGTYKYREMFNNSMGNWNDTGYVIFNIGKGSFGLAINSNVTSPITYPNASQVLGAGCVSEITCTIYRGNSSYSSATGKDDVLLGVGVYAYNYSTPGNANITALSASNFTLVVNQGTAIPLLFIIPTSPITYNTSSNASCYDNNKEQQFFLYKDYANVSDTENNTLIKLPAGTWNYECNATSSANYTSVATSQNYVVNQLYVATHITINGTEADKTYYYGNTTNVTAWNDTEITDSFLDLYRDGAIVANPDITILPVGIYTYITLPNSTNYTSNATRTLTILSIPAPPPTETKITFGISCDPFWVNFEIIAGFVLGWIGLCLFYILVKKLPDVTRPIIWFILILAMIILLFSTPYPTDCFTQPQIDFINILIIISIMVSVALGVFSVRG